MKRFMAALGIAVFSFASQAQATSYFVLIGKGIPQGIIANPTNSDKLNFRGVPYTSYCCEVYVTSASAQFSDARQTTVLTDPPDVQYPDSNFTGRGYDSPRMIAGPNARICFYPNLSGLSDLSRLEAISYELPIAISGTGHNLYANCFDTTLYGGYNTMVTDANFLEITNTSDQNVTARIRITNSLTGSTYKEKYGTITAKSRRDFSIHQIVGKSYGSIIVYHDGSPGSIKATLNQYNNDSAHGLVPVQTQVYMTR